MTATPRVAAFGALLVAIFALAAIAGRAAGPIGGDDEPAGHAGSEPGHRKTADPAAPDLRVVGRDTTLRTGRAQRFAFAIHDATGARVRDFEVAQGRRMHLIVVRRDLRRFQHLHPTQDRDGTWSTRLTLPDAGVYHAFADFQTGGTRQALGTDLFAAGRFEPLALPAPSTTANTDGYDVTLGRTHTGALRFTVSRGGAEVTDLQPYLGAGGHLVILRAGDLAYEHAHPAGAAAHTHPVEPAAARALIFDTGAAQPGTYRLFLQFRHRDAVHTAAFTQRVGP